MNGVFALVVHADAYQYFEVLEVVWDLLLFFGQFGQEVHQAVFCLERRYLVLFRRVIINDLRAIGHSDFG